MMSPAFRWRYCWPLRLIRNRTPHTTQRLAVRLEVSRSVVIRGLNRLGELGYIGRIAQFRRRVVVIRVTEQGRLYLDKFAESVRCVNLN